MSVHKCKYAQLKADSGIYLKNAMLPQRKKTSKVMQTKENFFLPIYQYAFVTFLPTIYQFVIGMLRMEKFLWITARFI